MTLRQNLVKELQALMPEPGVRVTEVADLSLVRCDKIMDTRVAIIYEPCIYIVVQGKKSAFLGEERYIYDAFNYLVLSVPLPLECQINNASVEAPYLAVKININPEILNELIQATQTLPAPVSSTSERGIFVSTLGEEIKSVLGRLLSYVNNASSAKVLGAMAIKELLFHVLRSEQGEQLKAFAYRDKHNFQIARVINFIQHHYAQNLLVGDLAAKANMSHSSFFQYFKAVTNSSPIQYIKVFRLHAARRKMLFDNVSASDAAFHVGYASPSQFSREYRRLFGVPPTKDTLTTT